MHALIRAPFAGALVLNFAACAGSTLGSGVGDAYLERPPFYAGGPVTAEGRIAHLGIAYQRGATQEPIFEPADENGSPLAALQRAMTAALDSLGASVRGAPSTGAPRPGPAARLSRGNTTPGP